MTSMHKEQDPSFQKLQVYQVYFLLLYLKNEVNLKNMSHLKEYLWTYIF
jgi:hypothetical protein